MSVEFSLLYLHHLKIQTHRAWCKFTKEADTLRNSLQTERRIVYSYGSSVTKNRNPFFSRTVFGIDQSFFIFQEHIRTFYYVYLLLKWTNKLLIQLLIPLIKLSRMAVFVNLQQEHVYLFATVKASRRTGSWYREELASGLKSRNFALLFYFLVPMAFLSPNFSVFLMLKVGNNNLQPKKYSNIRYSTLNLLFVLNNFLTPEC